MKLARNEKYNSFWIGLASFFGGISQDMLLPILPLYFTNVLHLNKSYIGLIDGMVTASATAFKIIAGYLSDSFKQRKSLILLGYFLSWISRPLLIFTSSGAGVLALRSLDGIGKGIKDSPKEALVADSAAHGHRGREFGIVRMLDTFGSVVGPFILMGLLYFLQNNPQKYHLIFLLSAVPLAVTLWMIAHYVIEPAAHHAVSQKKSGALPKQFYIFLGISLLFALGNFSDSFFIMRLQQAGLSSFTISAIYALFNFVYALAALPFGTLSDRVGRIKIIIFGWALFVAIHIGIAMTNSLAVASILFIAYGLFYATTFGAARAFIADLVMPEDRGKAYGIYNACTGLAALPASYCAGVLWDSFGVAAPFLFAACIAGCSLIFLFLFNYSLKVRR